MWIERNPFYTANIVRQMVNEICHYVHIPQDVIWTENCMNTRIHNKEDIIHSSYRILLCHYLSNMTKKKKENLVNIMCPSRKNTNLFTDTRCIELLSDASYTSWVIGGYFKNCVFKHLRLAFLRYFVLACQLLSVIYGIQPGFTDAIQFRFSFQFYVYLAKRSLELLRRQTM